MMLSNWEEASMSSHAAVMLLIPNCVPRYFGDANCAGSGDGALDIVPVSVEWGAGRVRATYDAG